MTEQKLISEKYLKQIKEVHCQQEWGTSGRLHSKIVNSSIKILGLNDILDYGCGRGTLKKKLRARGCGIDVFEYDPAIPGKDALPELQADLVTCTDVLEHIEPACIKDVLKHIFSLSRQYAYFVISVKPANLILPDGRNAHILLRPPKWWKKAILEIGWEIMSFEVKKDSKQKNKEIRAWLRKR